MKSEMLWLYYPPIFLSHGKLGGLAHSTTCWQHTQGSVYPEDGPLSARGEESPCEKSSIIRNYVVCFKFLYKRTERKLFPGPQRIRELWPGVSMGPWNPSHPSVGKAGPQRLDERWHCLPQSLGAKCQLEGPEPFTPRRMTSLPQGQLNLGTPPCWLWLEIQGSWNPFHQSPCLGAFAGISRWSKGIKLQNSPESGGGPPFAGQ